MPRKPGQNSAFVIFDVVYEDGTRRSNRKVPRALTGGIDGDKRANGFLIEQDRTLRKNPANRRRRRFSTARLSFRRRHDLSGIKFSNTESRLRCSVHRYRTSR